MTKTNKIRQFTCKTCGYSFERLIESNGAEAFIINETHCNDPMTISFIDAPGFAFETDKLVSIKIPRNRTSKLTLSIRRHQQQFLYDQMQEMSYQQRLDFLSDHLTSLQEANYELRERELATAKIKEIELTKIEKLNVIDVDKYRRTGLSIETGLQKKERTKFEKTAEKFKSLNLSNDKIISLLTDFGCAKEKAEEIVSNLK